MVALSSGCTHLEAYPEPPMAMVAACLAPEDFADLVGVETGWGKSWCVGGGLGRQLSSGLHQGL